MDSTDREVLELCKAWFEDIMERSYRLTSGNVSHGSRAIYGVAKNYAEYVDEHLHNRWKTSDEQKYNKIMTQKDKELLLKDLCARLPYGVLCNIGLEYPLPLQRIFVDRLDGILLDFYEDGNDYQVYLSEVKPYLRPMSSMTEEEKVQLSQYACIGEDVNGEFIDEVQRKDCAAYIDWLNKNHFDYRGLILKGFALEALKGMYNTKWK